MVTNLMYVTVGEAHTRNTFINDTTFALYFTNIYMYCTQVLLNFIYVLM
jgi:hypothetical protein